MIGLKTCVRAWGRDGHGCDEARWLQPVVLFAFVPGLRRFVCLAEAWAWRISCRAVAAALAAEGSGRTAAALWGVASMLVGDRAGGTKNDLGKGRRAIGMSRKWRGGGGGGNGACVCCGWVGLVRRESQGRAGCAAIRVYRSAEAQRRTLPCTVGTEAHTSPPWVG